MGRNKFDRSATLRTSANHKAFMRDPLGKFIPTGVVCDDARAELDIILKTFRACDRGRHKGPFTIDSPHCITICFESHDQREAFRKAMDLMNHGESYWDAEAFMGSLELLKTASSKPLMAKRENPFLHTPEPAEPVKPENASKYSELRAEVKKVQEKMKGYTEDRTWIAVCFSSEERMEEVRGELGLPEGKFVHVEAVMSCLELCGITLHVPLVPFGLRAVAKPDKALLQFVD